MVTTPNYFWHGLAQHLAHTTGSDHQGDEHVAHVLIRTSWGKETFPQHSSQLQTLISDWDLPITPTTPV